MTPEILFDLSPERLELANGDIHVFCASLDPAPARLESLAKTLSEDERGRAARFHFEKDKNRFVAGRGMLREILGWLAGAEPGELVFSYSSNGKPRLAAPIAKNVLHFNLAHSDSLAVYAVSLRHEVGIDLERIRAVCEAEDIMGVFFHERERAQWLSLEGDKRTEAFFNCWTRKEALVKASGEGIGGQMNQIDVSSAGDFCRGTQWSFHSLTPALDYMAVVASNCREPRINCWKWGQDGKLAENRV